MKDPIILIHYRLRLKKKIKTQQDLKKLIKINKNIATKIISITKFQFNLKIQLQDNQWVIQLINLFNKILKNQI